MVHSAKVYDSIVRAKRMHFAGVNSGVENGLTSSTTSPPQCGGFTSVSGRREVMASDEAIREGSSAWSGG
ncbi:hypothetical protein TYRP_003574 [Tyrophagus putrescentiae]|nr:hypothetical protein TYRP_003574 [Tyrophagus putrescentiae]